MLRKIIEQKAPDISPLRVALFGFSEGCTGVRLALQSADGPNVDAVLAIDGIHTVWTDKKKRMMSINELVAWRACAVSAATDGRLMVITTSAVVPSYVSTTYTSNYLWESATGTDDVTFDAPLPDAFTEPVTPPYTSSAGCFPDGVCWKTTEYTTYALRAYRKKNGLVILNYSNLDPTGVGDHRLQADRVSPLVLKHFLAPRWNDNEPVTGPCNTI
jgi:hypothetical protein